MSEYSLSTTSPFLKGLNTELNRLVDSTEYTNDELNCMIRANNTRSRRPGIDYEELYKFNNEYLDTSLPDLAFQCIEWTDINSPDEAETYTGYPYLVCQVGGTIIFFRNEGQPYSGHQETFTLSLLGYALDNTSDEYMRKRCKFTAAYGCIFITSEAIKPIYLRTAQTVDSSSVPSTVYASATISVAFANGRDLQGPERPLARSVTRMKLNGITVCEVPAYNGYVPCSTQMAAAWNAAPDSVRLGITATPKYPDGIPYHNGISSATQGNITAGEGAYVADSITFNAHAPHMEGNYIEIYVSITIVSVKYTSMGGSGMGPSISFPQETYTMASRTFSGTTAGGSNYTFQSNLNLAIRDTNVGATDYLGVADNPTKMSYAHLYNLLNQGWTPRLIAQYYNAQSPKTFPGNNLAQQFLKDDKTSAFKPQNAINMTFGNSPAARGHEILDYFNQRRVYQSNLVAAFGQLISEIGGVTFNSIVDTNWDLTDPSQANETDALSQVPDVKPRKPYVIDICAYAGRIFYLTGDVLLYSQVIAEDVTKADNCYTEADPAGEEISDVIETDGGLISLPDIGEGLKLQVVGDSLLIFGTRGNMMLSGTANNIFTATAYSAGAVPAVPTQSPDSFVSTEYGVFYWGVTGITALGVGAEGGLQTKDLTTEKILTWYGKLTNTQHKYCKGIYSASKKKIYWFYPSDDELPRRLDMCLVYDIQRDAFCPQQIAAGNGIPEVVSGMQLKVPFKAYKEYPVYANIGVDDVVIDFGGEALWREYQKRYTIDSGVGAVIDESTWTMSSPSLVRRSYVEAGDTVDLRVKFTCTGPYTQPLHTNHHIINSAFAPFGLDMHILDSTDSYFTMTVGKTYWLREYRESASSPILAMWSDNNGATWNTLGTISDSFVFNYFGAFGGDVDMLSAGDYATPSWKLVELVQQKYFYDLPVTADSVIYDTKEHTTAIGTVQDLLDAPDHPWSFWKVQSVVRDTQGADYDGAKMLYNDDFYYCDETVLLKDYPIVNFTAGSLDVFEDLDRTQVATHSGSINLQKSINLLTINSTHNTLLSVTFTQRQTGDIEVTDDTGYKILADTPMDTEDFTYESSILLCLDAQECKVTFGDFRNNVMRDWAEGDFLGSGYEYDSYMISHPVNSQDFIRAKTMPYLISYFKRTETGALTTGQYLYPSHCQGSVRWDWRTNGDNSKWDSPNELYRPRRRTILSEGFITSKTNIRGIGRAFQIKLQGINDDNFIVEALGFNLCKDERI